MSTIKTKTLEGNLKVSHDVVAQIAKVAALEIKGVDSISEPKKLSAKNVIEFVSNPNMINKAVDINLSDNFVEISIAINLTSDANISEICPKIQNAIKDNVQTMTGMAVSKVNVLVADVVFPPAIAE